MSFLLAFHFSLVRIWEAPNHGPSHWRLEWGTNRTIKDQA